MFTVKVLGAPEPKSYYDKKARKTASMLAQPMQVLHPSVEGWTVPYDRIIDEGTSALPAGELFTMPRACLKNSRNRLSFGWVALVPGPHKGEPMFAVRVVGQVQEVNRYGELRGIQRCMALDPEGKKDLPFDLQLDTPSAGFEPGSLMRYPFAGLQNGAKGELDLNPSAILEPVAALNAPASGSPQNPARKAG